MEIQVRDLLSSGRMSCMCMRLWAARAAQTNQGAATMFGERGWIRTCRQLRTVGKQWRQDTLGNRYPTLEESGR